MFYLLINKQICIFLFVFIITERVLLDATKTLRAHVLDLKLGYPLVIEVIPLAILRPHIGRVVSGLRYAIVNNHTF